MSSAQEGEQAAAGMQNLNIQDQADGQQGSAKPTVILVIGALDSTLEGRSPCRLGPRQSRTCHACGPAHALPSPAPLAAAAAGRRRCRRLSALCSTAAGMAGSGKTTFLQRLNAHLHANKKPGYIINLDPAVTHVPYGANVDIRDTVNYKNVRGCGDGGSACQQPRACSDAAKAQQFAALLVGHQGRGWPRLLGAAGASRGDCAWLKPMPPLLQAGFQLAAAAPQQPCLLCLCNQRVCQPTHRDDRR